MEKIHAEKRERDSIVRLIVEIVSTFRVRNGYSREERRKNCDDSSKVKENCRLLKKILYILSVREKICTRTNFTSNLALYRSTGCLRILAFRFLFSYAEKGGKRK